MKKLLLGLTALAFTTPATAQVFVEDFDGSAGTLGTDANFTTDYVYTAPTSNNNSAAQQYTIKDNAFDWNPAFASYGDNTTGSSRFMVVNGGTNPPDNVWSNAAGIALTVGARYVFSFALSNACCSDGPRGGPLDLSLSINNTPTLATFTSATPGVWTTQSFSFVATQASNIFSITNQDATANGNDFGIDDIAISAVPEPATWAMMIMGFGFVGGALRRKTQMKLGYAL